MTGQNNRFRTEIRFNYLILLLSAFVLTGAGPKKDGPDNTDTDGDQANDRESGRLHTLLDENFSLGQLEIIKGEYVYEKEDGTRAVMTMDPHLHGYLQGLVDRYKIPAAAVVVLNSRTGRVLAVAQRGTGDTALDSSPPAASIFKLVTAAALVEDTGTSPQQRVCYSGGGSSLRMRHLADNAGKNAACTTLARAMGSSINAVFARLSDKRLSRGVLKRYADAFGFNNLLPFDLPVMESEAEIPEDRLERARTAAGFWHTHLSPMHAAMIAQAIAQRGNMLVPYMIDRVEDADGNVVTTGEPEFLRTVMRESTAAVIRDMMKLTVTHGTAKRSFYDKRGRPFIPGGISVAGKTGTLHGTNPFRAYTWFMGFAPADKPEIAVAALAVNSAKWRVKGPYLAREALRRYFMNRKK